MSAIFTIARKELLHILRDPKTLAFIVGMPVMLLIIYGYGINFDVRDIRLAVVDYDNTQASREFIDSLTAGGYFIINERCESIRDIDESINYRRARVGVVVPPTFERDLKTGRTAHIQFIIDGSDGNTANIAYGYINALSNGFAIRNLKQRLAPLGIIDVDIIPTVDVKTRYWFNPELKSSNFIVPGIMAIIMMMIGAVATALTLVVEKENGTIEQLIVSPVKPYQIILGKLVPYVVLSFIALLVVILFALILFDLPVKGSLFDLLLLAVVYLICVLGIGIFVSSIVSDMSSAMMFSVLVSLLPSIILSGFVFPIRNMPAILQGISLLVPARYFLRIIRGIYLKGIGLDILWTECLFLIIFAIFVFGIAITRFRKRLD
jgi:ABC-2 type transport system permease protein